MTPVQIAYFKHFLFDRSLQRHYIGTYRNRKQKGNPESLEEFLQEASPVKAIMGAFYFKPGSEYGFDYWNDIKEKWLKYLELYADNPKNDSYMFLRGGFAILRQNWDKPCYYEKESDDETYSRMHIEKPDVDNSMFAKRNEKSFTPKFKVGDTVRGTISGDVCKIIEVSPEHSCYLTNDDGAIDFEREEYWKLEPEAAQEVEEKMPWDDEPISLIDFSDIPEAQEQKKEPENFLDGFSFEDVSNPHGSRRLAKNIVSVNLRSNSYKVTFSAHESDKILKHSHKYVKLFTKKSTMEIALTFNNSQGCVVSCKQGSKRATNVTINSKEMVSLIRKFFELKDEYFQLEVVSSTLINDNTTYILKLSE